MASTEGNEKVKQENYSNCELRTNGRMDVWTDGRTDPRTDPWTDEPREGLDSPWKDQLMDGPMDGSINEQHMNGRTYGRSDQWTDP